jgi:hypothetical protein
MRIFTVTIGSKTYTGIPSRLFWPKHTRDGYTVGGTLEFVALDGDTPRVHYLRLRAADIDDIVTNYIPPITRDARGITQADYFKVERDVPEVLELGDLPAMTLTQIHLPHRPEPVTHLQYASPEHLGVSRARIAVARRVLEDIATAAPPTTTPNRTWLTYMRGREAARQTGARHPAPGK